MPYESSEVRMLFLDGRDDMARCAEEQPLEAEPGAKFEYSSNTTVILADIAARVLTRSADPDARRKAVADYLHARLFGPLGMTSMVPEFDRHGTLIGGSLMHATARDWARFGEFLRNKGSYRGTQLVPAPVGRVHDHAQPAARATTARRPGSTATSAGEGATTTRCSPRAARKSLFAAIGHLGQYVLVAPDRKLTVVRLGQSDDARAPGADASSSPTWSRSTPEGRRSPRPRSRTRRRARRRSPSSRQARSPAARRGLVRGEAARAPAARPRTGSARRAPNR